MEAIGELRDRLEGEYAALEAQVRAKEAAEQRRLDEQAARLERAKARKERAGRTIDACERETSPLTERRQHVSARLRSVAGRLWMIWQVSALFVFIIAGGAADIMLLMCQRGGWILAQPIVLVVALFAIPRRR